MGERDDPWEWREMAERHEWHAEKLEARIEALEAALRALTEADPVGYGHGFDVCIHCGEEQRGDCVSVGGPGGPNVYVPVMHAADCPYVAAQALLKQGEA
jgi:hypothetical protein